MEKFVLAIFTAVMGFALLLCVSFILSFPVYWLWNNALMGAFTGVQEISWLQAWGINVLFGILFIILLLACMALGLVGGMGVFALLCGIAGSIVLLIAAAIME